MSVGAPPLALHHRLYVPTRLDRNKVHPLLVALHGCTQTAADFAAGTRFDALAERHGLVVLYPEQSVSANPQRCWNWFRPEHQRRDAGEPAALLALIESIVRERGIDRERVFVCGLSAGAAMAAILAEQAPDVVAAVGIMAGVALHSSHDPRSAGRAMRGDGEYGALAAALRPADGLSYERLRVAIWAGGEDRTVAPSNALILSAQFRRLLGLDQGARTYEETPDGALVRWRDATGRVRVEVRTVDGLGHAWSGGSLRGSHTAPTAPDAGEAMLDFFLAE